MTSCSILQDYLSRTRRLNTERTTLASINFKRQRELTKEGGHSKSSRVRDAQFPNDTVSTYNFSSSTPHPSITATAKNSGLKRSRNYFRRLAVPGIAAASACSIGYLYASNPTLFSWQTVDTIVKPQLENAFQLVKSLVSDGSNS
jgi:hypothetical protein